MPSEIAQDIRWMEGEEELVTRGGRVSDIFYGSVSSDRYLLCHCLIHTMRVPDILTCCIVVVWSGWSCVRFAAVALSASSKLHHRPGSTQEDEGKGSKCG